MEANLQVEARLNDADLTTAFCKAANFFMADLRGANCTETFLQEADLLGANLRDANLRLAQVQDAKMSGAEMRVSLLHSADLLDALCLTARQVSEAETDERTTLANLPARRDVEVGTTWRRVALRPRSGRRGQRRRSHSRR